MIPSSEPSDPAATRELCATDVVEWQAGSPPRATRDNVAEEEPLEIRIRGQSIAVTMRTPGNDEELAAGFLVSENLIHRREDVIEIEHCRKTDPDSRDNILNVFLAPNVTVDFERLTRHVFASSSCGVCGKASIESVQQCFAPVPEDECRLAPDRLLRLPDLLRNRQDQFARTGGLHAAGIFDLEGNPVVVREDVGRHNAVDKAVGHGFLKRLLPFPEHVLMVSGRASFEILQKALSARIPIVAAVSAPSSLAVQFARDSGQTLVGFLRDGRFNIYAHPERILARD